MVRGLAGERGVGHAEGQMLGSAAHQEEEWPGMSWYVQQRDTTTSQPLQGSVTRKRGGTNHLRDDLDAAARSEFDERRHLPR